MGQSWTLHSLFWEAVTIFVIIKNCVLCQSSANFEWWAAVSNGTFEMLSNFFLDISKLGIISDLTKQTACLYVVSIRKYSPLKITTFSQNLIFFKLMPGLPTCMKYKCASSTRRACLAVYNSRVSNQYSNFWMAKMRFFYKSILIFINFTLSCVKMVLLKTDENPIDSVCTYYRYDINP